MGCASSRTADASDVSTSASPSGRNSCIVKSVEGARSCLVVPDQGTSTAIHETTRRSVFREESPGECYARTDSPWCENLPSCSASRRYAPLLAATHPLNTVASPDARRPTEPRGDLPEHLEFTDFTGKLSDQETETDTRSSSLDSSDASLDATAMHATYTNACSDNHSSQSDIQEVVAAATAAVREAVAAVRTATVGRKSEEGTSRHSSGGKKFELTMDTTDYLFITDVGYAIQKRAGAARTVQKAMELVKNQGYVH